MRRRVLAILQSPQFGISVVIILLGIVLTAFAGNHLENGHTVNNFLNPGTLIQVATETSFFAIMAVGMAMVIISGGIDLSVGSIYALCGTTMALLLRSNHLTGTTA